MDVTFKVAQELEMSKRGVVHGRGKAHRGAAAERRSEARCRRGRPDAAAGSSGRSCLNASIEPFSTPAWGRMPQTMLIGARPSE